MSNQLQENYTTDLPDSKNNPPIDLVDNVLNEVIPLLEEPTSETPPTFPFYDIDEYDALPDATYCVNGLITHKSINLIFGDSGSGKTFVTLDLVIGATLGYPFLDRFEVPQPLKVAYMTNEGHGGVKRRLNASINKFQAKYSHPIRPQIKGNFLISHTQPQLYDTTSNESITKFVNEVTASGRAIDILVIDTLSNSIVGGTDSADKDMRIVESGLKYAIEKLGCAIVVVHHTNKGDGYRGSTVIRAMADLAIKVSKSKEHSSTRGYEIYIDKVKDELLDVSPREGELFPFYLQGDKQSLSCFPIWDTDSERTSKQNDKKSIDDLRGSLEGEMTQTEAVNVMTGKGFTHREAVSTLNRFVSEGRLPKPERGGKTGRAQVYDFSGFFLDNNNTSLQSSK